MKYFEDFMSPNVVTWDVGSNVIFQHRMFCLMMNEETKHAICCAVITF